MSKIYETMTRVLCCGFAVRVWRTAPSGDATAPDEEVRMALEDEIWQTRSDIAERVEKITGVAAYEILDGYGNGIVCYTDWP